MKFSQFLTEKINNSTEYFSDEALRRAISQNPKSRSILFYASPEWFLEMATTLPEPDTDKASLVKSLRDSKTKFDDVPSLYMKIEDNVAYIVGHEGRHRTGILQTEGQDLVPILITDYDLRWGCQLDPAMKYDYFKEWPTVLISENGKSYDFPFTRDLYFKDHLERIIT